MTAAPGSENDPLVGELTPEQEMYKENIIDHYKHPHNKLPPSGALDSCTHHERGKNPLCGDKLEVFIAIDGERVSWVGFRGDGCAISQASMSMLTDRIKGKAVAEVLAMGRDDIVGMLGIPVGPVRMKCAMLGLRTTQSALAGSGGATTEEAEGLGEDL